MHHDAVENPDSVSVGELRFLYGCHPISLLEVQLERTLDGRLVVAIMLPKENQTSVRPFHLRKAEALKAHRRLEDIACFRRTLSCAWRNTSWKRHAFVLAIHSYNVRWQHI